MKNTSIRKILSGTFIALLLLTGCGRRGSENSGSDEFDFIGLTEEEAVKICNENNLKYNIEYRYISDIGKKSGTVSEQEESVEVIPAGGEVIREKTYKLTVLQNGD